MGESERGCECVGVSMNASVVERMCRCRCRVKWVRVREGVSVAAVTWGPRSVCERGRTSWALVNVGAPQQTETDFYGQL